MEMSSSRQVPAPRESVWAALNDPDFLKECIEGCEALEAITEDAFRISMVKKIGAIRAKFNGKMRLAELNPPESYTLIFEGEGGMAGFAKGQAGVTLMPDGDSTVLIYEVSAQVGGKLAQIGSRLIDSAAQKTADEFFAAFVEKLSALSSVDEEAQPEEDTGQASGMEAQATTTEEARSADETNAATAGATSNTADAANAPGEPSEPMPAQAAGAQQQQQDQAMRSPSAAPPAG